ncbi:hypothetical protein COU14_01230 [Candidatus Kaiserbacteria bacterium CG10_big_fil_rev_8_21_14_0_10_44_10]|uniref:SCP domain-containing protein n=1 Tax=Candidatus Kaiserbacteria bacterium CG10_big_fil_rev_8_21_14_0_10_44_10 TaxID=1974606 RepID=A0A2H0UHY5_9BACT|nr:MAG: hypothetical protein COU14_01230 [Candidatus Kaiserbacteria bacterium CG10_big_fil_rev_8_21_14_0_10_44_10]
MKNWLKKVFVPNADNDFRPHVLQRAALVGMMGLVLVSFSIANLQSILWISSDWLVSTILPAVVTDATNSARAEEGKSPLVRNPALDEAARLKAEDMAKNEYFAHWSPTGVSPWHWFGEAGYSYVHAGENLAVHFTDSSAVVDAWLKSPTHRENIMNAKYTEIGIGTAKGQYEGYDTVFVVQMFGTPAAIVASSVVEETTVPATTETEVVVAEDTAVTEDEPVTAPPVVAGAQEDTEASVGVTEEGTVVYESFASTVAEDVAEGVEEVISAPVGNITSSPSMISRIMTSPRLLLQIVYSILGLFVIGALLASIIIEWRRHHPVQIAYATAMLLVMMVLFQLHIFVSNGALIA